MHVGVYRDVAHTETFLPRVEIWLLVCGGVVSAWWLPCMLEDSTSAVCFSACWVGKRVGMGWFPGMAGGPELILVH